MPKYISGSAGDADGPKDAEFPGPGLHNLVKSRTHGGECLKCGLLGSWDWIKSQPCKSPKPTPSPVEEKVNNPSPVVDHTWGLSEELDQALQAGKPEEAMEIMTLMEIQHENEKREDEEVLMQIMEEELKILEMTEQLMNLGLVADQELADIQMKYAMDLSLKDHVVRPPASPSTSVTPIPVVSIAKPPAICT